MAAGPITQVADIIVPEIFTAYTQQLTEEKARLVQSGVLSRNPLIDEKLAGGGLTFNIPSFNDLDNDADRVSTDATDPRYNVGYSQSPIPNKITTAQEIAVRLSRNNSWSTADLAAALAGADPLAAIANRVGFYWARRLQAAFVATMVGLFNDNEAVAGGTDTHVQNDMTNDISGTFADGVTTFSAEAFIDAVQTMGDSQQDIVACMVHSVVFSRMQKNNLIDMIPDARGEITIPTFLGREVIVDDGLPNGVAGGLTAGDYSSWLFGVGAVGLGVGSAKVPTEVSRRADGGNGGGQDVLHSRVEWSIHPAGHRYAGTAPDGGPANGSLQTPAANELSHAGSWSRIFAERKQIKIARLITTES
jgi:hypothetical protein